MKNVNRPLRDITATGSDRWDRSANAQMAAASTEGYERGLGSRQVQMIAIGGAIGVGLFLGAGKNIEKAGTSLILMYALAGVIVFFIMRALGELLLYRPVSGSFAEYAREFLGPFFGYVTGWTYWLMWAVTGMTELTAAAIYINYWFPDIPQWTSALAFLVLLFGANLSRPTGRPSRPPAACPTRSGRPPPGTVCRRRTGR